ncbi:Methyltransferase-like protein 4 [Phlyctochytrium planicorne]|nr:Methyltransferase-like protein 4 [Phlyctochytrium planicorne]
METKITVQFLSHERQEEGGFLFQVPVLERALKSVGAGSGSVSSRKKKKKNNSKTHPSPYSEDAKPQSTSTKKEHHFHCWASRVCQDALRELQHKFPLTVASIRKPDTTDCVEWTDAQIQQSFPFLFNKTVNNSSEYVISLVSSVLMPPPSTSNIKSNSTEILIHNRRIVIPPKCSFIMSDFALIDELTKEGRFDFILLDPPWANLSVQRANAYADLDSYELFKVPMDKILNEAGLVAIWVTNHPKFIDLIKQRLFPAWNLKLVGEWLWLKVDTQGAPLVPLASEHRKPYEALFLGRSIPESGQVENECPTNFVMASLPSAYHSQKPILDEIVFRFIKPGGRKLEIFARNLRQGWFSWGNEVLKFQDSCYFAPPSHPDSTR